MDHLDHLNRLLHSVLEDDYSAICFHQPYSFNDDYDVYPQDKSSYAFRSAVRALSPRTAIKARPSKLDAVVRQNREGGYLPVGETYSIPIVDSYRELTRHDTNAAIVLDEAVLVMWSPHSPPGAISEFYALVKRIVELKSDEDPLVHPYSVSAPSSPRHPLFDDFDIFGNASATLSIAPFHPSDIPTESCAELDALTTNLAPLAPDRLGLNSLDDIPPPHEQGTDAPNTVPSSEDVPAVAVPEGYVVKPTRLSPARAWDALLQHSGTGASKSPLLYEEPRLHPGHALFNGLLDEYLPTAGSSTQSFSATPLSSLSTPPLSESLSSSTTTAFSLASPDDVAQTGYSPSAPTRDILGSPPRRRESHMSELSSDWQIDRWDDDPKSARSRMLFLAEARAASWAETSQRCSLKEETPAGPSRRLATLPSPSPSPIPTSSLCPVKRLPSSRAPSVRSVAPSTHVHAARLHSLSPPARQPALPTPSPSRTIGKKAKRADLDEEEDDDHLHDEDADYDMDADASDAQDDDEDYRAPKRQRVAATKKLRKTKRKATVARSKRRFPCPFEGCTQTFGRKNDAQRHVSTACGFAGPEYKEAWRCPYPNCADARRRHDRPENETLHIDHVTGQSIFSRRDACKRHMKTVHSGDYRDGDEPTLMPPPQSYSTMGITAAI